MASGDTLLVFSATDNRPPASAFATLDTRNAQPCLDFDGSTDEEAVFEGVMPMHYGGSGVDVKLHVRFTSATSGTANIEVSWENRQAQDIDSDSFATMIDGSASANGTSGVETLVTIAFSDGAAMDSVGVGDSFRIKVRRDSDGTNGTDDIATDMELYEIEIEET